jgi:hypothetical protein
MMLFSTKKTFISIGKTSLFFLFLSFSLLSLACLGHQETAHAHSLDIVTSHEHSELGRSTLQDCVEAPLTLNIDRREETYNIYPAIIASSVYENSNFLAYTSSIEDVHQPRLYYPAVFPILRC